VSALLLTGKQVSNDAFQEDGKRLAQCVEDAQDEVYASHIPSKIPLSLALDG
jgi:hypothetical protein